MAIMVAVPSALEPFAGEGRLIRVNTSCATLGEVLAAVGVRCPGVIDRVLTEQGALREHVNVFVGEESARLSGGLAAPVRDGDTIEILAAVSGG